MSVAEEDNITGFLVPPKDIEQLAEKIVTLLKNDQRRIEFGKCGLNRVKQFYGLERMADQYLRLYKDVLHKP